MKRLSLLLLLGLWAGQVVGQSAEVSRLPANLVYGLENASDQFEYREWLDWLDNYPERFGTTDYINEPLIAGGRQTIRVRYRAGVDLPIGSRIAIAAPFGAGITFQFLEPSEPNYIEVRSDNFERQLVAVTVPAGVPFNSWYEGKTQLAFEIQGAGLQNGEEIQFELRNLQLPTKAGPFYLPLSLALPGQVVMYSERPTQLLVQPNRTERVQLIAPSRVGRSATTSLELRIQDRFGNLTAASLPTFDLLLNGTFVQRVTPTTAVTEITDVRFSTPGTYVAEVRTGGGSLRATSNPIVVQSGNKQIDWFDLSPGVAIEGLDVDLERASYRFGGSVLKVLTPAARFDVAVPYSPTDDRNLGSDARLVQIAAGESQYEWFANRMLQRGYRLGFAAGSFTPLMTSGRPGLHGLTASISGGLALGKTYATTGERIVVHATVNGAEPGSRIAAAKERRISGWVQGTTGIDRIELLKNGTVIDTYSTSKPDSNLLKISLKSSSEPIKGQRDRPRNGREWIGFVRTSKTPLTFTSADGFRNSARQAAAQNGERRVDFITWTHGGWSSFVVSLDDALDDEVVELSLRGGLEDEDIPTQLRAPATIPAARQMIPLFDLANGPVTRTVQVAGYEDEIRFEFIDPEAPDYLEFRFLDLSPFAEEDYYYIRVLQHDDAVAWTSPVFVGGFDLP